MEAALSEAFLEEYTEVNSRLWSAEADEAFVRGFRLGAELVLELGDFRRDAATYGAGG